MRPVACQRASADHRQFPLPYFSPMNVSCFRVLATVLALASAPLLRAADQTAAAEEGWISLFNSKDLDGWTIKVAKYPIGENYLDTFRVEDGILKVAYDRYGKFN